MVRLLILIIAFFAAAYPAAAKKQEHATPRQVIQKEVECLTTNEASAERSELFFTSICKRVWSLANCREHSCSDKSLAGGGTWVWDS
ncbi:hypothetical protein [Ectobacillus panaciterrae]|uniref:hypothetical protein n=1 Tax=Ectobacillus panaciterrae TaxID=363872 RepID=UPI0003F92151|nr:hypothetical protein [Ectobacillus panaciterrae]